MRGKRRQRGTWFPTIGSLISENPLTNAPGRAFVLNLTSGAPVSAITPLTFDFPADGADATDDKSLADIIGSEYLLRRIVGKLHLARITNDVNVGDEVGDGSPAVLVAAGFFVARANDDASGGGPDTPIGSATFQELFDNYSPLALDTIREPWIWRRSWLLGAAGQTSRVFSGQGVEIFETIPRYFPCCNAFYGSVLDGPHIDAKTARRVTQDERLWFAVTATSFPLGFGVNPNDELRVQGYLDYRLFGMLRKARNRGVF